MHVLLASVILDRECVQLFSRVYSDTSKLTKMSESGDEIFITQSRYSLENSISDTNVMDCILNMEEDYSRFEFTYGLIFRYF